MRSHSLLGSAACLLGAATTALAAPATQALSLRQNDNDNDGIRPSFNVKSCPGYKVAGDVQNATSGFTVPLALAGDACNAFGVDIKNLTLAVVYEKPEQLHVHIYDTAKQQFQLPNGLLYDYPTDDPAQDGLSNAEASHFEFHHTGANDSEPWAFWVTRKSNNDVSAAKKKAVRH